MHLEDQRRPRGHQPRHARDRVPGDRSQAEVELLGPAVEAEAPEGPGSGQGLELGQGGPGPAGQVLDQPGELAKADAGASRLPARYANALVTAPEPGGRTGR